jgi:uncharacterized protein YwqG
VNLTKEILLEKIEKTYQSPLREYMMSKIKPAIGFRVVDSKEDKKITKIGGVPWIKEGEDWPRSKSTGKPLLFLLQLELEQLKQFDINANLPAIGIISFYFDSDDWEGGGISYYETGDKLKKAEVPEEYYEEVARKQLPSWKRIWAKQGTFKIFKECSLEFFVDYQIPSCDSVQVRLFELENEKRIYDYLRYDTALEENFLNNPESNHHLLGYYVADQESTYELYLLDSCKDWKRNYAKQSLEEASEWSIFLKLESEQKTQMSWVDAGNLFFFIKSDDLKNRNFDNVRGFLDTT